MGAAIGYLFPAGSTMKAVRLVVILLLFAAASAAYVWLRSGAEPSSSSESITMPDVRQEDSMQAVSVTNEAPVPVDPLEERGDAMLFEAEALGNTPFDEAIVKPFD
jgi:hypothetical protein